MKKRMLWLGVFAILALGACGKKEQETNGFGITVNGKFYEYSAEAGISDFQEIENKVYVCKTPRDVMYYEKGSAEPKVLESVESSDFWIDECDLVTAYWVSNYCRERTADKKVVSTIFCINENYSTGDGLNGKSTYEDALGCGYRPYGQNEAIRIFDCNGEVDWKEAERLAEQAISEDSFACLEHIREPFYYNTGDIWKPSVNEDNVAEFLEWLGRSYNQPPKDTFIGLIAQAMEIQKIQDGEIDCFVMYAVSSYDEEKKGFLPLDIHICTLAENIEQWDDSWGVTIPRNTTPTTEPTSTPEPTVVPTPTAAPTPTPALDATFDEPFEISVGEELLIGRPGVSVRLNGLSHWEDYSWINYTLIMDGVEYEGYGSCDENGGRLDQRPFTNQVVKYVDHGETKVTLLLTEDFEVQKPLVLSGNAEDIYITEKPEYVESERIIMFIDKGIEIPGNLLEQMETLMTFMEEETGFSYFNDTRFSKMMSDTRFVIWGNDAFTGVDMEQKKFHIFVVPHEVWWPSSSGDMIVLGPEDIRFGDGDGDTAIHELAHAAHQRNGVQMNRIIDEGYASYIEGKICAEDKLFTFDYDADENYNYVLDEITAENAEAEFVKEREKGDAYYLYGYWFITYLFDNYGEDIFHRLLTEATANADEYQGEMTKEEMVPIVKTVTSEDIFEKFGAWFEETAKDWPRATIEYGE